MPHPGYGEPRQSRLTKDEEQTEFTLWSISRSPLILGANLTKLDDFTRSLITNKDVLTINQRAVFSRPLTDLPAGFGNVRVWEAAPRTTLCTPRTYAFFNLDDKPVTLKATWKQLGLDGGRHMAQNVWSDDVYKESKEVNVTLPAHGSTVYQVQ